MARGGRRARRHRNARRILSSHADWRCCHYRRAIERSVASTKRCLSAAAQRSPWRYGLAARRARNARAQSSIRRAIRTYPPDLLICAPPTSRCRAARDRRRGRRCVSCWQAARARFDRPVDAAEIAKLMETRRLCAHLPARRKTTACHGVGRRRSRNSDRRRGSEARRRGVGAALVTRWRGSAGARAASMHLRSPKTTTAARAFTQKLATKRSGRRHAYYAGEGGSG